MPQNAASDQDLQLVPVIQQLLDTLAGSKIDLLKVYDKYGKEFRCPNI